MENKLRLREPGLELLADAALSPVTGDAVTTADAAAVDESPAVLIVMPGFAAEREERREEAEAGVSVIVALVKPVGMAVAALVCALLRFAELDASIEEEK